MILYSKNYNIVMEGCNQNEIIGEDYKYVKINRFNITPFWRQVYIVSAAWNLGFMFGMAMGTNTVAIPQMKKESIEVSEEMRSWLGSVFGYGSICGHFVLTPIIYYYGVKKAYIIVCASPFFGSIVIYTATSSLQVLCGQAIQSIMLSSMTNVSVMVLTEYVSPENRSLFFCLKSASVYWGIWVANAIGTFFNWRYIAVTSIVCSLYGTTILLWPESPFWLANKGRTIECMKAFRWSRGIREDTELELKKLIENSHKQQKMQVSFCESVRKSCKDIRTKEFYFPMFLALVLLVLNYSNGKIACTLYAIELLESIVSDTKWVYSIMLILDGFSVFAMYCGCFISKNNKRRPILFTFTSIGIISLYLLSVQSFLVKKDIISQMYAIPLILFITFTVSMCLGPLILLPVMRGEIIPLKNRLLFCNVLTLINQLLFGSVMKMAPFLFKLGNYIAFFTYGSISIIAMIVLFIMMPETKGKTNLEISEGFRKTTKIDSNKETVSILEEYK